MSNPIRNLLNPARSAAVHLLDLASGRRLKSWKFDSADLVSIGRADDQDVQISDPYVSRTHAVLRLVEGHWQLHSLGRNGVLVQDQLVNGHIITGDITFRLGADGPALQFQPVVESEEYGQTMFVDVSKPPDTFQLDTQKIEREVHNIADGDYFQKLQDRARQMRKDRKET